MIDYPLLYNQNESSFSNNGLGALYDIQSCEVTEELNGSYELTITYPVGGIHFDDISLRSLIMVKPNLVDRKQPFRVYRITRPIDGKVKIYAEHISYDLNGIPIVPFQANNLSAAVLAMNSYKIEGITNPFKLYTINKTSSASITMVKPVSFRNALGGMEGSILDVYGGEYLFDRYSVYLLNARGVNRNVSIRYGKNMSSLEHDDDGTTLYSGVMAYWYGEETNEKTKKTETVVVSGNIRKPDPEPNFVKIYSLDATDQFESKPSKAQLNAYADEYIAKNHPEIPNVSIKISYVENPELMEIIGLGDTVSVIYDQLGINGTAKCTKAVFDVLKNRYKSITLGNVKAKVASTLTKLTTAISDTKQQMIDETRQITTEFKQDVSELSSTVNDNKGNITQIVQDIDSLTTSVSNLDNSMSLIMTGEELSLDFKKLIKSDVDANINSTVSPEIDAINSTLGTIDSYIRFNNDGIILGQVGSPIQLRITKEAITFGSPNVAVTYATYTSEKGQVNNVITDSVQFGQSTEHRNFIWRVSPTGHLSLMR